jgi:alginate O-acetyltransferase complex protein AlgI
MPGRGVPGRDMTIVGLPFLLIAIATVLGLHAAPLRARRAEVLTVASLAFVASVTASIGDALCLALMAATGWAFVKLLAHHKRLVLLGLGIGCVVAEFVVTRQILPQLAGPPWLMIGRTIGLSYVMFRVIHVIVDAHGDELPAGLRLRDYVCFLFCYLTFLAGPIQRIQTFSADLAAPLRVDLRSAAGQFVPLIVAGTLKFTLVAAAFFACFIWSQHAVAAASLTHAVGWLSFAAYLYFSFAGYTDVVRGIGGMIALDLPQNFDRPYAAANFLDFWSRWHISLSDWFKLYVFNPAVKEMIAATGRPALVAYLGAAGYFITFFLMGLWHGVSLRFVLYGLCLGAGVSVNKLYQTAMLRRLGRQRLARLTRHPAYATAAQALAVGFFILALGFLWIPADPAGGNDAGGWAGGAGLVVLGSVLLAAATRLAQRWKRPFPAGPRAAMVLYGAQAVAVLAYLLLWDGFVPPLLYAFF